MKRQTKDVLGSALEQRWEATRAKFRSCRAAFSVEAVHDLRVAIRRLLAVFEIVDIADPHPSARKVRRVLKAQLDDLDELRDVQVMLVDTSAAIGRLPELLPFQSYLEQREGRMLSKARRGIEASNPAEMRKSIKKIRAALAKGAQDKEFASRILRAVDSIYFRATLAYQHMDAAEPASIHRLRIAFKKFRYSAEIVLPMVPAYPASYFEDMHAYQAAMGAVHDIETLQNTLRRYAEKAPVPFDVEPIRRHYETRHAELVSAYYEDKARFLMFWRAGPDLPFPWEKKP